MSNERNPGSVGARLVSAADLAGMLQVSKRTLWRLLSGSDPTGVPTLHQVVSKRTLWRLLSGGKMLRPVRIGRSTRWRLDEVERWIAAGCPDNNHWQTAGETSTSKDKKSVTPNRETP